MRPFLDAAKKRPAPMTTAAARPYRPPLHECSSARASRRPSRASAASYSLQNARTCRRSSRIRERVVWKMNSFGPAVYAPAGATPGMQIRPAGGPCDALHHMCGVRRHRSRPQGVRPGESSSSHGSADTVNCNCLSPSAPSVDSGDNVVNLRNIPDGRVSLRDLDEKDATCPNAKTGAGPPGRAVLTPPCEGPLLIRQCAVMYAGRFPTRNEFLRYFELGSRTGILPRPKGRRETSASDAETTSPAQPLSPWG